MFTIYNLRAMCLSNTQKTQVLSLPSVRSSDRCLAGVALLSWLYLTQKKRGKYDQ